MDNKPSSSTVKRLVVEILWDYKKQPYATTRWAWVQLLLSIAFFLIALALAIIALVYSFHGVFTMPNLVIAGLILGGIAIVGGFVIAFFAIRMGYYWYSQGSQDPTATKSDIDKLQRTLSIRKNRISDRLLRR